ncbi:MAG: hypothetical protein ACQ9MH_09515 [Nitrospinales bacterium]
MFVFNPLTKGLELLALRDLQNAETLFLKVINDPYVQSEDLGQARIYLNDVRSCQTGQKKLDFAQYGTIARKSNISLENVYETLSDIYFSPCQTFAEFDDEIDSQAVKVISRLKQIKIRDIIARDQLFKKIEKTGLQRVQKKIKKLKAEQGDSVPSLDVYRWKTLFRKFIQTINPILLERHLELLEYILDTGEIELLDDPKLNVLTSKYRWIIESTLDGRWFLLRSYFFKAKSEIANQFNKKTGTRKYWEEVKYKKIKIFERCGFQERSIQKFLFIDKLNYQTLEEICQFAESLEMDLIPRDVSLALRGVDKAKDHIRERSGLLMGGRKEFQNSLVALGFNDEISYQIASRAKKANSKQISDSFVKSLEVARDEIYWYRVPPQSERLRLDIMKQCRKHLSTVRIHLFDRGRLNKLLIQVGKPSIRQFLINTYGEGVVNLHCYFRLETIHQYYKLKYFQYHAKEFPSVSELIKISRKEIKPMLQDGYKSFIKKRRLVIPDTLFNEMEKSKSVTFWEDPYTTTEEKFLLRFWFLMDHDISITQGLVNKGMIKPGADLWGYLKRQDSACNI